MNLHHSCPQPRRAPGGHLAEDGAQRDPGGPAALELDSLRGEEGGVVIGRVIRFHDLSLDFTLFKS